METGLSRQPVTSESRSQMQAAFDSGWSLCLATGLLPKVADSLNVLAQHEMEKRRSPLERVGTHNALPTPSHKWPRRSHSTGYVSIRTLDPLVVTQGFNCGY